jgi:phage terminase large subunit-like protein
MYDWGFWARDEQLPPGGEAWFAWFIRSGRGWGKTRTGAEFVRDRVEKGARKIAIVGQTKADVRDTMIELGDSGILRVCPPWNRPIYEPSKRRLIWKNGAIGMIYSGDEPDQLRGPQHDTAWVDELAKFKYPQDTWDNLEMGMRLGSPKVCLTTTPRPIPLIKTLLADPRTVVVAGNTFDNAANLPASFVARIKEKYSGTRLGRQEIEGEILDDNPRALWHLKSIEANRVRTAPSLIRIVVAIDPAVSSGPDSAETGIVAAGLGADGHGYVLADKSLMGTPKAWAAEATGLYYLLKADRILAEVNNGGDMVESTVRMYDEAVAYKAVHASRGKATRAEPVSALYEQNKVHHVGCFPELEDQMCSWMPGDKSPDRMDALVWALTELMVQDEGATVTDVKDAIKRFRRTGNSVASQQGWV